MTPEHDHYYRWLDRLNFFGITRTDFNRHRDELTRQFGSPASVNDTVWRILNSMVIKYAQDNYRLEHIYREMAALVSQEGKDPTPYLEQAEEIRRGTERDRDTLPGKIFLAHDELAYVRKLRKQGKLCEALDFLMKGIPSPAVLDEIRKTYSAMAKISKKDGDWATVVQYLEAYEELAQEHRAHCIRMVNQAPPEHTATDNKLLEEAKKKLISK